MALAQCLQFLQFQVQFEELVAEMMTSDLKLMKDNPNAQKEEQN